MSQFMKSTSNSNDSDNKAMLCSLNKCILAPPCEIKYEENEHDILIDTSISDDV